MRFPKIIELLTISAVLFSGFEASSKLGDAESNSMRDEVDLIAQQLRPADFIQLLSEGQMGELTVERPGHYSAGVLAIKRFLNDPSETDKDKFLEVLNEFMATCSVSGDWGRVAGDLLAESILLGMGIQPKKKPEEVGTFVPSWHFADTNIPTSESVIVSETDGEETWKIDLAKDHSVMAGASAAKMLLDAGTAEDHLLLAMGLLGDNDSLRKTVNQVASDMDAPSGQAFMQTLLVLNQHLKVFVEGTKFVPAKALARLGTFLAMCRHPEDLQGRKEFQKTFFDEIVTMVIDSITRETFNAFEKNEEFDEVKEEWPGITNAGKNSILEAYGAPRSYLEYVFGSLDGLLENFFSGRLRTSNEHYYSDAEALSEFTETLEYSGAAYEKVVAHVQQIFPTWGDFVSAEENYGAFNIFTTVRDTLNRTGGFPTPERFLQEMGRDWITDPEE